MLVDVPDERSASIFCPETGSRKFPSNFGEPLRDHTTHIPEHLIFK
jgi:hypothetical protein